MPRSLIQRCQADSIHEFRSAAYERYNDGLSLAIQGRRTAAIYVWGYSIEMILKSAYFSLDTHRGVRDPITIFGDINPAMQMARTNGIAWSRSGAGHNILAWAEWLITSRIMRQNRYSSIQFERELRRKAQQAYQLWRETLRYHPNTAYLFEVRKMRDSAEWFLVNFNFL